jgi:hypothetical protein
MKYMVIDLGGMTYLSMRRLDVLRKNIDFLQMFYEKKA